MKYILSAMFILTVLAVVFYPSVGAETPIEPVPRLEEVPKDPCWYVEHFPNEPIAPIIMREQIKRPIDCKDIANLSWIIIVYMYM